MEIYAKRLPKAMYNSRVLFNPYQYEPLMKLFDSDTHEYNAKNILITDEVGVGKTVEAGIIIKEYLRLYPNARVIIICPAKLCENWKEEMDSLFDEKFKNFREDKDIEEEDPSIILPNSFFIRTEDVDKSKDEQVENEEENSKEDEDDKDFTEGIKVKLKKYNLQTYDLLIVDEAHSIRNKGKLFDGIKALISNNTSKLQDELRIFMTATPVVNKDQDYKSLEELLKLNTRDFENTKTLQGQANCYDYQLEINMKEFDFSEAEKEVIEYVYFDKCANHNRGYMKRAMASSINTLCEYYDECEINREKVVENEINEIKEIKNHNVEDKIRASDYFDLDDNNVSYSEKIKKMYEKMYADNTSLNLVENNNQDKLKELLNKVKTTDSKFKALMELVNEIKKQEDENNEPVKIVIFTWSKCTAKYLEEKLKDSDYIRKLTGKEEVFCFDKTAVINGDTKNAMDILNDFEKTKNTMVLIGTEAAREGLNMQFCHNLIHYDFPFTPASLCQRNGRIYRPRKEYDSMNPRVWYMYSRYGYDVRQYDEIILSKLDLVNKFSDKELIVPMNILPVDNEKLKKALFINFVDTFVDNVEVNENNKVIKIKNIETLKNYLEEDVDLQKIFEENCYESENKIDELIKKYIEKGCSEDKKKRENESLEEYKKEYCKKLRELYKYIFGEEISVSTTEYDTDEIRKKLLIEFSTKCGEMFREYSKDMKLRPITNGDIKLEDIWYSWQIYSVDGGRKLMRILSDGEVETTRAEFANHYAMWRE